MRIRGEIFKTRSYPNYGHKKFNCISFLEVEHEVLVGEDKLKIIPILSEESDISGTVGEKVEVQGKIEWKRIITSTGKPSFLPIPVLVLQDIKKSTLAPKSVNTNVNNFETRIRFE